MKLITEEIESIEIITESVGKTKKLYIKGPFLQAETVNKNRRRYPISILEREVNRYNNEYVNVAINTVNIIEEPWKRKIVLYNPISQNIGIASSIEISTAKVVTSLILTNSSSLK